MTTTNPEPGQPASSTNGATVAGLAREVEQLRRTTDELRKSVGRVDDLAGVVKELAATVYAHGESDEPSQVAPSWLDRIGPHPMRDDTEWAIDILERLTPWVAGIYLRYSDAKLPDCWLWHPDVVEELIWLQYAWAAAYDPDARPTAVGDWHDRQRPGVVARVKSYVGFCSLEAHQPGQDRATPAPAAPTVDAVPAIAGWWAISRDQPGPAPSAEQIEAARQRVTSRGHR